MPEKKGKEYSGDLLFSLLGDLVKANVKFVVCGGIACVLHGVERATYDLDIYADLEETNLRKIAEICKQYDLIPRIPEPVEHLFDERKRNNWVEEKGAMVYTFVSKDSPLQLDIFLNYPIVFEKIYHNSKKIIFDKFEVLISSAEDLVEAKSKIESLRDKDILDIKELKKLYGKED